MKKKIYNRPSLMVVDLENCDIICQSLGRGNGGDSDAPTAGPGGFISVESGSYRSSLWDDYEK